MTIEELKARVEAEGRIDLGKLPVDMLAVQQRLHDEALGEKDLIRIVKEAIGEHRRQQNELWDMIFEHYKLPPGEELQAAGLNAYGIQVGPRAGHIEIRRWANLSCGAGSC